MFKKKKRHTAQSTLEYAVLIVLVTVALLATQTYIKRAMQGKIRSAADDIGEQFSPGASTVSTSQGSSTTTLETVQGGVTNSYLSSADTSTRFVNTQIGGFNSSGEYWPSCGDGRCVPPEDVGNCPADCS
jgi:Flp pilus assembly pilin Flp